jgi:hypothetical protein
MRDRTSGSAARRPGAPARRRRRTGHRTVLAVTASLLLTATACGTEDEDASLGGFGLPVRSGVGAVDAPQQELAGALHVESNGCFTWDDGSASRPWVVWPDGAEHAGDQVVLPDGTAVGAGDPLVGTGGRVDADAFEDWANPDSYLSAFGGFCDAGDRGIVVLDEVRRG